jgi:hypothetical protein
MLVVTKNWEEASSSEGRKAWKIWGDSYKEHKLSNDFECTKLQVKNAKAYEKLRLLGPKSTNAIEAKRIRDDKADVASGARWNQIDGFLSNASVELSEELDASKIIRREVWTKTTGDKTDVRKLVVWQTNKANMDTNFPEFVVHWTDYSSTRKEPLAREVKLAPSLKAAEDIAASMIEANIKKGWEPVKEEGK